MVFEKEDRLIQDKLVSSTSSGSPLVWDRDFGIVPVDEEHSATEDGRRLVRVYTLVHAQGSTVRTHRLLAEGGSWLPPGGLPVIPCSGRPEAGCVGV